MTNPVILFYVFKNSCLSPHGSPKFQEYLLVEKTVKGWSIFQMCLCPCIDAAQGRHSFLVIFKLSLVNIYSWKWRYFAHAVTAGWIFRLPIICSAPSRKSCFMSQCVNTHTGDGRQVMTSQRTLTAHTFWFWSPGGEQPSSLTSWTASVSSTFLSFLGEQRWQPESVNG